MYRVLVIGLGSPMRGDDAVGHHAAYALEEVYRDDGNVQVMAVHQLTPELAEDLSQRDFVLFLDAAIGDEPGVIRESKVCAAPEPHAFSHHLTPSSLVAAAESLYGDAPEAMSLTISGESFKLGGRLSSLIKARIPELTERASKLIEVRRRSARREKLVTTRSVLPKS